VTDREALVAGRIATVATGLVGMCVALAAVGMDIRSIWELFLNVLGLTTGALAGVFALGILTTRANGAGATIGLVASIATICIVSFCTALHPLMYGAVGVCSAFGFGYFFSLFFPPQLVDGLTIHTSN
jgi:Na+/proline symporter